MRLIDAEAFKQAVKEGFEHLEKRFGNRESVSINPYVALCTIEETFLGSIDRTPAIEAKPVVHAHWVTDFDFDPEEEQELYFYFCSKCKNELFGNKEDFKYCPYCGAQMDENHIAEVGKKEGE